MRVPRPGTVAGRSGRRRDIAAGDRQDAARLGRRQPQCPRDRAARSRYEPGHQMITVHGRTRQAVLQGQALGGEPVRAQWSRSGSGTGRRQRRHQRISPKARRRRVGAIRRRRGDDRAGRARAGRGWWARSQRDCRAGSARSLAAAPNSSASRLGEIRVAVDTWARPRTGPPGAPLRTSWTVMRPGVAAPGRNRREARGGHRLRVLGGRFDRRYAGHASTPALYSH